MCVCLVCVCVFSVCVCVCLVCVCVMFDLVSIQKTRYHVPLGQPLKSILPGRIEGSQTNLSVLVAYELDSSISIKHLGLLEVRIGWVFLMDLWCLLYCIIK